MRASVVAVLAVLCGFSAAASTITAIDPSSITAHSGEYFMTITGRDLGRIAHFSGKAGEFDVEASSWSIDRLTVWVPTEVIATPGVYSVIVGDSGPASLEVIDDGPDPLMILGQDPITAVATSREGAIVTFDVPVYGGRDPNPAVKCDPPSGSMFPIGPTSVQCTATNSFGERAEGGVYIFVYDIGIPLLHLPSRIATRAEGDDGATVTFEATATDVIDGEVPVSCKPESGSRFPIGVTAVVCTATDSSGNTASDSFEVEVVREQQQHDTLVIHVPGPVSVEAEGPDGTAVTFIVTADGTSDPSPDITCDPASGSTFPVGTTTVHCVATDDLGNSAAGEFTIDVTDSIEPLISSITATPDTLSPPNNKLVPVTIEVEASDVVDPMPRCFVFSVTANEPIAGDYQIKSDLELELRAARGGEERLYTVHVRCVDDSANAADGSVIVRVPKGSEQTSTPAPPPAKKRRAFKGW